MALAGRTLLGIDVGDRFSAVARGWENVMHDCLARFGSALPLPPWVPTPRNLRLKLTLRKLDRILARNADRAAEIADATLAKAYDRVGFLPRA